MSSFIFSTISTSLSPISSNNEFRDHHSHCHTTVDVNEMLCIRFPNTRSSTKMLIGDLSAKPSSSFDKVSFVSENHRMKKVHSLFEAIEELCILIRKLLQHELTEQKITLLQATIAHQLAILLSYLAMPNNQKIIAEMMMKNTTERMISTDENHVLIQRPVVSNIGTQTNIEWIVQLNDRLTKILVDSFNNIHSRSELSNNSVKFRVNEPLSFKFKHGEITDIELPSKKATSHTESMSASSKNNSSICNYLFLFFSASFHLPGHRPNRYFSDTLTYHIHRQQQYSSSYNQLISWSETDIHSLQHRFHDHRAVDKKTKHMFEWTRQKLQRYIELESSNTCLEASTEFTPDFLLTTINNSKYGDDDDDEQTEQFGINTEKQDYQIETICVTINKQEDTLTFNSTDKGINNSLDFDIEPGQS